MNLHNTSSHLVANFYETSESILQSVERLVSTCEVVNLRLLSTCDVSVKDLDRLAMTGEQIQVCTVNCVGVVLTFRVKSRLCTLSETCWSLKAGNAERRLEAEKLEQKVRDVESQLDRKRREVKLYEERCESVVKETNQINSRLYATKRNHAMLEENQALQRDGNILRQENDRLQRKIASLNTLHTKTYQRTQLRKQHLNELYTAITTLQSDIYDISLEANNTGELLSHQIHERQQETTRNTILRQTNQRLEQERVRLISSIADRRREYGELELGVEHVQG
eukprot:130231-Hanusia_phi.AAC.2